MLKYSLKKSSLTGNDDYYAKVQDVTIHSMDDILELLDKQDGLVGKEDARLILNTLTKVIKEIIEKGEGINIPLMRMYPSITGIFTDINTPFEHSKHAVNMNLNLGKDLTELLPNIKVHKEKSIDIVPEIIEVLDVSSASKNNTITSGGVLKVFGSLLKVAGTDASIGMFFIDTTGTRLKVSTYVENYPSSLIILLPTLVVGSKYTIEIITQYSTNKVLLKTPKIGTFSTQLTAV